MKFPIRSIFLPKNPFDPIVGDNTKNCTIERSIICFNRLGLKLKSHQLLLTLVRQVRVLLVLIPAQTATSHTAPFHSGTFQNNVYYNLIFKNIYLFGVLSYIYRHRRKPKNQLKFESNGQKKKRLSNQIF